LRFEHALRAAYQDIACGSASAGVGPYGSVGAIWSIRSPRPYHPVGALRGIEWVIYTKRPFAGPEQVLAYLGRYTHRVATANSRLIGLHENKVNFTWKDYRHHGKTKVMTLAADEFIRRFLLHAVPDGFHRIRHVGFLANRRRTAKLALCRALLAAPKPEPPSSETYRQPAESLGPSLRIPIAEGHVRRATWHRSATQSIGCHNGVSLPATRGVAASVNLPKESLPCDR
jgi:hypothetical protein